MGDLLKASGRQDYSLADIERFDRLVDRIERAKSLHRAKALPYFRFYIQRAEKALSQGLLESAKLFIVKAEDEDFRIELIDMAHGDICHYSKAISLINANNLGEAAEFLLA